MPVYDKPMIYYPLATLMLAGIREVLIINTPHEQALFQRLLGDGSQWGIEIEYAVQPVPGRPGAGLPDRPRFHRRPSQLPDPGRQPVLRPRPDRPAAARRDARARRHRVRLLRAAIRSATAWPSSTPTASVIGLEEKPDKPRSHYAVTGLYFYDERVCDFAADLKPSPRGELEITDLNRCYLEDGSLMLEQLGRGYAWLDTGTHDSLVEASNYIATIENRQGLKVCCPEEIAFLNGWINADQVQKLARPLAKTGYGRYLTQLVKQGVVR